MNQQREVIYTRRQRALEGDRLKGEIFDMLDEFATELVGRYFDEVQVDALKEDLLLHLLVDVNIKAEEFEELGQDGVKGKVIESAKGFYNKKEEMITSDLMARLERYAVLSVIDHKWKEHLREMDDLKEGIGLRAYGQKDPLVEYKGEAFKLFVLLLEQIRDEVVSFAFKFFPQAPEEIQSRRRQPARRMVISKQDTTNIGLSGSGAPAEGEQQQVGKLQPVQVEEKIGRNDPCPCGSGKKYKNCHGK
jgi:preprotein translocase subunit SecA